MIYLYLGLMIGGCVGFFAAGLMRVAKITELESDLRSASSRLSWALKEADFWKDKYERLDTLVHGNCVMMAMPLQRSRVTSTTKQSPANTWRACRTIR